MSSSNGTSRRVVPAAHFTRLGLVNWRNFKKVDAALGKRAFVVGPNAAGKTNLLDAFCFLSEIAKPEGNLARAVQARSGIAHLRSLHAGQNSNLVVHVELSIQEDRWRYELELSGTKSRPLRVERELVHRNGNELLSRPNSADERDERLRTQTHLEQLTQNERFRPLVDALAGVVSVHIVPQVARDGARAEALAARDAPGSDFINQLARLPPGRQKPALARIERLLQHAVPQFSELRVERDDVGRPHLEAKYQHWRLKGAWQNEQEFSDGTLRLIGLLWAINEGAAPLLLEEPELSLHRDVVRQIPRLMAAATERSGRQVIVSTHAEEMLADTGIDPAEVLLLKPGEHETTVRVGSTVDALVRAARARQPFGSIVTGLTRPGGVEQLAFSFGRPVRRITHGRAAR